MYTYCNDDIDVDGGRSDDDDDDERRGLLRWRNGVRDKIILIYFKETNKKKTMEQEHIEIMTTRELKYIFY